MYHSVNEPMRFISYAWPIPFFDDAGLLFEEFVDIDKGFTLAFCLAVFCVMIGLFVLSHRQQLREHGSASCSHLVRDHHPSISSSRQHEPSAKHAMYLRSSSDMGSESEWYALRTYVPSSVPSPSLVVRRKGFLSFQIMRSSIS